MSLYESKRYLTIYEDDGYMIWLDAGAGVANIFFREKGLTLHFSYEDFQLFRESVSNLTLVDMDGDFPEVYIEERGIGLHFGREEFHIFVDILNSLRVIPKWLLCWN